MLNIFIGFDQNESIAYHVLAHSIMRRASRPVSITPLFLPQLQNMGIYTRKRDKKQSTDFTFSRFLTPWLARTSGVSVFLDCDMLCLGDICELETLANHNPYADVFVAKHDYTPKSEMKFLGQEQTRYPCKNWSSVMVFNGHRSCVKALTPEYVNGALPMDLHQFKWAQEIGALPLEWNWLVGEYEARPTSELKLLHYTLGGPYFQDYAETDFAAEWFSEYDSANSCKTRTFY
jgi:hypothetical protein